jgi:hypothetical protein
MSMGFFDFYGTALLRALGDSFNWTKCIVFLLLLAVGLVWVARRGKLGTTSLQKLIKSAEFAAPLFILLVLIDLPVVVHSMWQEEHGARVRAEALLNKSAESAKRARRAALLSKLRQDTSSVTMASRRKWPQDWSLPPVIGSTNVFAN